MLRGHTQNLDPNRISSSRIKSAAQVITVCFWITYRYISIIYLKEDMGINFYGSTFRNAVFAILKVISGQYAWQGDKGRRKGGSTLWSSCHDFIFFSLNALPVFLWAAEKMVMSPFLIKLLFLFLMRCSLLKSRGFYFTETCWFWLGGKCSKTEEEGRKGIKI